MGDASRVTEELAIHHAPMATIGIIAIPAIMKRGRVVFDCFVTCPCMIVLAVSYVNSARLAAVDHSDNDGLIRPSA